MRPTRLTTLLAACLAGQVLVALPGQAADMFGGGVLKLPTTASGGTGAVADLQADDDVQYTVAKSATATIGGFGTFGTAITSVRLFVQYTVENSYTGTNAIKVNGVDTTIVPAVRDYGRWAQVDITGGAFGIDTSAEISTLAVTFNNNHSGTGKSVFLDCVYVVVNPQTPIPMLPTWCEDFNGTGQANPQVWNYEVGYQRNNELQYYVPGTANGWQEGGNFVIEGRRESIYAGHDYTSASIVTTGKYYWHYGRAQIRARIPCLAGMWPAIWGCGETGQWPYNGEVDIMEYYGSKILANCAVGNGQQWTAKWDSANRTMTSLTSVDANWKTQWHIWTMQWDDQNVRLYVDNILMNTIPQSWLVNTAGYNTSWGPSQPFITNGMSCWLNLAIGGNAGGDPSGTAFPQRYYIDYWKVWEGATNNVAPADIALSPASVSEGQPIGTVVGDLSAADADPAEVFKYTLVSGTGSTHNAQFTIPEFVSDNTEQGVLKTAAVLNYVDGATRSIRVRVTDIEGATYDKVLTINVLSAGQHVTYHGNGSSSGTVPVDSSAYAQGATVTVLGNTGNLFRSGYNFAGWNTAADGSGTSHAPAATFAIGASDVTLYAMWTAVSTYTVSYNSNGSTSGTAPSNQTKTQNINLTLAINSGLLAKTGYTFDGWNTAANGSGTGYAAGATYSANAAVILHAKWNALPVANAGADQLVYMGSGQAWTPANTTTAAWYDAADGASITQGGGTVSQWNDKSGNARHLLQAAGANQPGYSATGWNGILPALTFDGTSDYVESAATLVQASTTMLAVYEQTGTASSDRPFGLRTPIANSKNSFAFACDNSLRYDGANNPATIAATVGRHLRVATRTNSAQADFVDGSQNINAAVALTANADGYINVGNACVDFSTPFASKVAEAIVLPIAINQATREQFEGYLAHKWGLAANLPAGHPYKSSAPTTAGASLVLSGSASDPEGATPTVNWSTVNGPGTVTFGNSAALTTAAIFPVAGTYTLRLTVTDGLGQRGDDVVITVSSATAYMTWSGGSFAHPFAVTTPGANPDGDCLNNLQEFAFGCDPTDPVLAAMSYLEGGALNRAGLPVVVDNGGSRLAVFTRRKDHVAAGLTYSVDFSADMTLWSTSATTPALRTSASDPGDYEAVSVPYPATVPVNGGGADQAPKFFRVGVSGN